MTGADAFRHVLRLTETIADASAPESVRREARARRAVIARRHCIGIIRFPPRRKGQPPLDPARLLAGDPGRLLIPHCARARTSEVDARDLALVEAMLAPVAPAGVTPPEVVYVHCGRHTCTTCALAEV